MFSAIIFRILSIGTISSPAATGIVDVGVDTGALLAATGVVVDVVAALPLLEGMPRYLLL